ncbi:hypothetical protein Agub_g12284, partial [Astrephomene gubernaculifera]
MAQVRLCTLKEAQSVRSDQGVSVYACIVNSYAVIRSNGNDHYMHLVLKDDTLSHGESLYAVVFGKCEDLDKIREAELPLIIHVHHAKTQQFKGSLQLLLRSSSGFAVYAASEDRGGEGAAAGGCGGSRGAYGSRNNAAMAPLMKSTIASKFLPPDPERVQQLRRWIQQQREPPPPPPQAAAVVPVASPAVQVQQGARLVKIQDVAPPSDPASGAPACGHLPPVDLICRVLAVDFTCLPHYFIVHVWDGTDAQPLPLHYTSAPPGYLPPEQQLQQQPHQHPEVHQQQQQG